MAEASPVLKGRNSGGSSRIPRLQRSASFHGEAKKFSRTQHDVTEEDLTEALDDLGSLSSVCSVASCATPSNAYRKAVETACDFRRGSLSSPRYALHCTTSSTTSNGGIGEYLTPTQRANRTIRQLKTLLKESEANSNYKDFEIQRLTRELVGLRLEHAHCTKKVAGAETDNNTTHLATPSLADSGHFDDLSYQASQSKELLMEKDAIDPLPSWSVEKNRIINAHTEKMEDLIKQHTTELQDIRTRFTDRLELALTQLGDSNTRYANLLTNYDHSREELKQAETEHLRLRQQIKSLEHKVTQLQIEMEERETLEYESREKELIQIESLTQELANKNQVISDLESKLENLSDAVHSATVSNIDQEVQLVTQDLQEVSSLLEHQQEERTEQCVMKLDNKKESLNHISNYPSADPSIILKFLRSAIFYLLTDSENGTEHLRAIQSILEFSPEERNAVERMGRHGYL